MAESVKADRHRQTSDSANNQMCVCLLCSGMGRWEEAIQYYGKAAQLAPGFSFAAANEALGLYQVRIVCIFLALFVVCIHISARDVTCSTPAHTEQTHTH